MTVIRAIATSTTPNMLTSHRVFNDMPEATFHPGFKEIGGIYVRRSSLGADGASQGARSRLRRVVGV